jgi:TatD DNase family protein
MLIDTHCHLNLPHYQPDLPDVIARATAAGVTRIVIPAVDMAHLPDVLAIADQYAGVYAAVGVHPNDIGDFGPSTVDTLRPLARHPKVVAVGEIGLDYYWNTFPHAAQQAAFAAQLDLAAELDLPVIIHNREASADVVAQLVAWARALPPTRRAAVGVLHSVSAPWELVQQVVAVGFYVGFTGPITYKKADETRQLAAQVPLDRIVLETDGPYLTPHPHRGQRNEPAYLPLMNATLATVRELSAAACAAHTTANAYRLFGWG